MYVFLDCVWDLTPQTLFKAVAKVIETVMSSPAIETVIGSVVEKVRIRVMSEAVVNGVRIVAITAVGGSDCGGDAGRLWLIMVIVESVVMVAVIFMARRGCLGLGKGRRRWRRWQ